MVLGEVTKKLKGKMLRGKEVPTVTIEWDGMPDVGGWEEGGFEPKELKDHLFNRDKEGAWRLDVALAPVDEDEDNVSDNDGESLDSDSADNDNDSSSNNCYDGSISTDSKTRVTVARVTVTAMMKKVIMSDKFGNINDTFWLHNMIGNYQFFTLFAHYSWLLVFDMT